MKVLHLRTGCRLHFGLMELAPGEPLRFAGMGLMLTQPSFELAFSATGSSTAEPAPPSDLTAIDPADFTAETKLELARRIAAVQKQRQRLLGTCTSAPSAACHVKLLSALPLHTGLGAGTQLAASVATGLELFARAQAAASELETHSSSDARRAPVHGADGDGRWHSVANVQPALSPQWLSRHASRGLRSAVGLVGFLRGGLIVDEGYTPAYVHDATSSHAVRPLAAHALQIVAGWRVVLIAAQHRAQVSGAEEAELMAELGSLANPHRNDMLDLAQRLKSLATRHECFADFTDCLEQYMELGAQLFCRYQGGLYNGADVTEAVHRARSVGLRGVGQSSWGPTVFGFAESHLAAERSMEQLLGQRPDWSVRLSTPATHGAEFRWQ